MSFWGPFSHLFESKSFPHARTRRTGFGGKLWDTWETFFGRYLSHNKIEDHLGLFDYATGLIFYVL